jgi:hypothetical protein
MSASSKLQQLRTVIDAFRGISLDALVEQKVSFPEWEGLSVDEFLSSVEVIKKALATALDKDVFKQMPFGQLTGVHTTLQNLVPVVQQFVSNKDLGAFQNAAQQVDSLHHMLYAYGIVALNEGIADANKSRVLFEGELGRLIAANVDVEKLSKNVRALIEPAVSGSLSVAFSARVRNLFWTRVIWGVSAVLLGVWGLYEATLLVAELKTISSQSTSNFWQVVAMRSIVLVPVYIGFGFVLSQYKKERDFEEEYAHKAALSTSLPNYRDLAKNDVVRDQIASKATEVIFSPPTKRTVKDEKLLPFLDGVKDIVNSVSKSVRRD